MTKSDTKNSLQNIQLESQQLECLSFINRVASELFELNTLKEVCDCVTNAVVEEFQFEDCVIYLFDNASQSLKQFSANGYSSKTDQYISSMQEIHLGQGIVGVCAERKEAMLVKDVSLSADYRADTINAKSELSTPILFEGEILGVIDCESSQSNFFTELHLEILNTLSTVLSAKVHKTFALDTLKKAVTKLETSETLQKSLFEIASLTYSCTDINDFYHQVHAIIGKIISAENFYIALFDQRDSTLYFPYYRDVNGMLPPVNGISEKMLKESLTGIVFRRGQPLLASREDLKEIYKTTGCLQLGVVPNSYLAVPFSSGTTVKGVVCVQSYNSKITYTQQDKGLFVFVAQHLSNVLEKLMAEKHLYKLALHDALTGLPNRYLFNDRVDHSLEQLKRQPETHMAVMYLDLDKFKSVNDTLGHLMGDAFLVGVTEVLTECIRETDTLARLGGDEFVILVEGLASRNQAYEVADRIINTLKRPIEVNNTTLITSTSIGIAFPDESTFDSHQLLQRADSAMYRAKELGRGRYCTYSTEEVDTNSKQIDDIEISLINNDFKMVYQPILDLSDNKIVGYESLIRWHHPVKGIVPPNDFIPLAEQTGLIRKIDRYVIRHVFKQKKEFKALNSSNKYISINISGVTFSEETFVTDLLSEIDNNNLNESEIVVELTEQGLIANFDQAKSNMETLRRRGIRIFLDDFGTGYSSLSYLNEFSVDALKIDKSFINKILEAQHRTSIIKTIVALAKSMKVKVVAEGIEQETQLNILNEIGCDLGQGYLFSKPISPEELAD